MFITILVMGPYYLQAAVPFQRECISDASRNAYVCLMLPALTGFAFWQWITFINEYGLQDGEQTASWVKGFMLRKFWLQHFC